ncbi:glycosyltransferase [Motilimonas eburnea]|uniref:glycosyltransferase n=1 Tax=Motilimonas eburnea TaxID=1737488 RepID=UPI001E5BAC6B|nr:glycosyltransferase [Motilimonas eburnea]MCE2572803.1 hypothetical protein [Motilimonas eburnea]
MNILVTVGAQLPFSRLIKVVDAINESKRFNVLAQIGEDNGHYEYVNATPFLTSSEYKEKLAWCDVVIAHAGMGTIIQCLELNKKLIVVPRLASYSEHRNDHQLDTIARFEPMTSNSSLFRVCTDMNELEKILVEVLSLQNDADFFSNKAQSDEESLGGYIRSLVENEI